MFSQAMLFFLMISHHETSRSTSCGMPGPQGTKLLNCLQFAGILVLQIFSMGLSSGLIQSTETVKSKNETILGGFEFDLVLLMVKFFL